MLMKCAYCGAEIDVGNHGSYFYYEGPDKNGRNETKYKWWNREDWRIKCQEKLFKLFCEGVSAFQDWHGENYDEDGNDSKLKKH